jgi:hypothetical protein
MKKLKELAAREVVINGDHNPYDASGGNYDDAYTIGIDDGQIILAKEILKDLEG